MKKIIFNIRYYLILLFGVMAVIGLFCEPSDDLTGFKWFAVLIVTKVVGLAMAFVTFHFVQFWGEEGAIPELWKLVSKKGR